MPDQAVDVLAGIFQEQLGEEGMHAAIVEAKRRGLAALEAFVGALRAEDVTACKLALCELQGRGIWPVVAFAASECQPSDAFRLQFMDVWVDQGDLLRDEFCNDTVLIEFLRAMLP